MLSQEAVREMAIEHVLKMEGGYIHDPKDRGGETNYGISSRAYPDLDIPNITREQAAEIYRRDYWNKARCDDLPPALAFVVMDYAVNSGVRRAVLDLQRTVGAGPDGVIGPKTLSAVDSMWANHGLRVVKWYSRKRIKFLISLDSFAAFGNNWLNRVLAVTIVATQIHDRCRSIEL